MIDIFILNSLLIAITVATHYEMLRNLYSRIPLIRINNRLKIVVAVFGALLAHVIEIWLFGFAYYFMCQSEGFGTLQGNFDQSLLDSVYFSFSVYTSLGFGDIEPFGDLRFTAGLESLTGLVMIGWTASFLYMEMRKFWESSE